MLRSMTILALMFGLAILFPVMAPAVPDGVVLKWTGGGEGAVQFDGTLHANKGLHCDVCHVKGVFQTKKGADPITMDAVKKEKYCGYCHNGKRAFSTKTKDDCKRCHKKK